NKLEDQSKSNGKSRGGRSVTAAVVRGDGNNRTGVEAGVHILSIRHHDDGHGPRCADEDDEHLLPGPKAGPQDSRPRVSRAHPGLVLHLLGHLKEVGHPAGGDLAEAQVAVQDGVRTAIGNTDSLANHSDGNVWILVHQSPDSSDVGFGHSCAGSSRPGVVVQGGPSGVDGLYPPGDRAVGRGLVPDYLDQERQRPASSVGAAAAVGVAGGAPSTSGAGAATSASALTASAAAASASFDESDGNQQQQRRAGRGGSVEGLQRGWSLKKISVFNTPIESINAENTAPIDLHSDEMDITPVGGIPARNAKGERLFLYMGIIDILQNYRLFKKMEHAMKSIITDGDTVSVHNPRFYSERFQLYLKNEVFKRLKAVTMKSAPSRRRAATRGRSSTIDDSGCLSGSDGLRPASMMATVAISDGLDDSGGSALSTVAAAALPQSQPAGAIDDRDSTLWDSATPRLLIKSGSHGERPTSNSDNC
uniref:PIPK domain-containing protein n=1 Tax=Macrostomum lignano TaxID=282301 RepID=A0A1I8INT8_9PLAT